MRELQTMAGSLLLDKSWKEGSKVENSKAFWRYNEKREEVSLHQTAFVPKAEENTALAVAAA